MSERYEHYELAQYEEICALNEAKSAKIMLVRHTLTGQMAVKKLVDPALLPVYESLRQCHSRHVAQILAIFDGGDQLTVIEEYINGRDLHTVISEDGPLPLTEALVCAVQLCDGLQTMHRLATPVIHRDIKPSNIMLTGDGIIKIIDFDAARIYKGEGADTTHLGTAGHSAPEQYGFGESGERADIYAVGVLLNEMLTGKLPGEERYQGQIGRVIRKCTELDPRRRYRNIRQLRRKLNRAHQRLTRTGRQKLRRLLVGLLSVVFIMMALIIANAFVILIKSNQEPATDIESNQEPATEAQYTPAVSAAAPDDANIFPPLQDYYDEYSASWTPGLYQTVPYAVEDLLAAPAVIRTMRAVLGEDYNYVMECLGLIERYSYNEETATFIIKGYCRGFNGIMNAQLEFRQDGRFSAICLDYDHINYYTNDPASVDKIDSPQLLNWIGQFSSCPVYFKSSAAPAVEFQSNYVYKDAKANIETTVNGNILTFTAEASNGGHVGWAEGEIELIPAGNGYHGFYKPYEDETSVGLPLGADPTPYSKANGSLSFFFSGDKLTVYANDLYIFSAHGVRFTGAYE